MNAAGLRVFFFLVRHNAKMSNDTKTTTACSQKLHSHYIHNKLMLQRMFKNVFLTVCIVVRRKGKKGWGLFYCA